MPHPSPQAHITPQAPIKCSLGALALTALTSCCLSILGGTSPSVWAAPAPQTSNTQLQKQAKPEKSEEPKASWRLGLLSVETDIKEGSIELKGKRVAPLPLPGAWTFTPGTYTFTFREGSWSQTRTIEVKAQTTQTLSLYRDPQNAPQAQEASDEAQDELPPEPPQPKVNLFHPGAGITLTSTGYALIGLGAAALAYGVYEQLNASESRLEALEISDRRPQEREKAFSSSASAAWRSRLALGSGGLALLSGVALSGWGQGGWFESLSAPTPTVAPVFGPEASHIPSRSPREGWAVSASIDSEGASVWGRVRW
jgi:hypothetical protein